MNGSELLKAWRSRGQGRLTAIAKALGVKHPTLIRWESGKGLPSLAHQLLLERVTEGEVPVESWGTSSAVVSDMRAAVARREVA